MTFELALLMIVCLVITLHDFSMYRTYATPAIFLSWPITILSVISRTIGIKYGIRPISNGNILILALGLASFECGCVILNLLRNRVTSKTVYNEAVSKTADKVKDSKMIKYVIFVEIVTAIRYLIVFSKMGIANYMVQDGGDGIMVNGLGAHLMFSMYPFVPVLFKTGILEKKKREFFITVVAVIEAFLTFTKYHVMFLVLACLITLILERPKLAPIVGGVAVAAASSLFAINYILNFRANGWTMPQDFLMSHFLNYLLGSISYSTLAPDIMIYRTTTENLIMSQFVPVINLFLNAIAGVKIWPLVEIPFIAISEGEVTNVMNLIAYIYSTHNYIAGSIYLIFLGFAMSLIGNGRKGGYARAYVLTIMALSFFVPYFQLLPTWEILIYSFAMPQILKLNITIGKKSVWC